MKYLYRITMMALGVASVLWAGCTSERKQEAALARLGDEKPPDFLAGTAAVLLTNWDGFSAEVAESASPAAVRTMISGDMIGRQGHLFFQPKTTANVKKGKIVRGGMFFVWDTRNQDGYVLSEALQGYAPVAPLVKITNVSTAAREGAPEPVNGHPCHRAETVVGLGDGSMVRWTEWRADDLKRFPVRMQATIEGRQVTVDFTNVRLDLPAPELFAPPGSFTKYASSAALINELMIRESSMKKGATGEWVEPGPLPDNSWRQPTIAR